MTHRTTTLALLLLASSIPAQRALLIDAASDTLHEFRYGNALDYITAIGDSRTEGLDDPADLTWRRLTQEIWTVDATTGWIGTLRKDPAISTLKVLFTPMFDTGASGWHGLAWHERDKCFYLTNADSFTYRVEAATGATSVVGPTVVADVTSLDTDADGELFGITPNGTAVVFDRTSGKASVLVQSGSDATSMAVEPETGAWLVYDSSTGEAAMLDPLTGVSSGHRALTGSPLAAGIEIPERRIDAYFLDGVSKQLYAVDKQRHVHFHVSTLDGSMASPAGITYVPSSGQLWSLDADDQQLGTVNPLTGTFTPRVVLPAPSPFYLGGPVNWTAMAWDPVRRWFRLVSNFGDLFVYSLSSGNLGFTASTGSWSLPSDVVDIAVDESGAVYGTAVSIFGGPIVRINGDGSLLPAGSWSSGTVGGGLAYDQRRERLESYSLVHGPIRFGAAASFTILNLHEAFALDATSGRLATVDLEAGSANGFVDTDNHGLTAAADLTYDADRDELWALDEQGGEIGALHPVTGVFRPAFDTGLSDLKALAWDADTGRFYLADDSGDVFSVELVTGVVTPLGASGFAAIHALDVDDAGNLYGVDHATGALLAIDKASGDATAIATTLTGIEALAIDAATGDFVAVRGPDASLYAIDPSSGASTLLGPLGAGFGTVGAFEILDPYRRPVARMTSFGLTCAGVDLTAQEPPLISAHWQLDLSAPNNAVLGFVRIGDKTSTRHLGPLAPGCTQYVGPNNALLFLAPFGPFHQSSTKVLVPTLPQLAGQELYAQGAVLVPGANALGVGMTGGIHARIGW